MHFRTFVLLASLFAAASVHAYDDGEAKYCDQTAQDLCNADNGQAYDIQNNKCLAIFWKSLTRNKSCPHPTVNCLCYNGCVTDRSGFITDVGGWCTAACRLASQPSQCE
ncbi:hypothetical protein V8E36_006762 [Tilletia maclaganii]